MKKALAEIIAGVIPNKMARNRWRGLLRYGALRAWKLKRRMKRDTTPPEYYLAVCAIAKNEGPYFEEWIEWHRRQGVEKFYIYDNAPHTTTASSATGWKRAGLPSSTLMSSSCP